MNKIVIALAIGAQILLPVLAEECAFYVRIVDDENRPIPNATVWAQFTRNSEIMKDLHELTDTNGIWSYQGPASPRVGLEASKDGYYKSYGETINFTNFNLLGRAEPWNELREIQLRRIINPTPMYARKVGIRKPLLRTPELGKPVGFDLIKSDWVAPCGKGETSDFYFCIKSCDSALPKKYYEEFPRSIRYRDMDAIISFSNDGDGILCVIDDPQSKGSVFRLSRYAPESGYESNLVRVSRVVYDGNLPERQGDPAQGRPEQNYYFRVRSGREPSGGITNALYGKIRGPIELNSSGYIKFTYYLNPKPNDRNLEYDTHQNLLKGIGAIENPSDP